MSGCEGLAFSLYLCCVVSVEVGQRGQRPDLRTTTTHPHHPYKSAAMTTNTALPSPRTTEFTYLPRHRLWPRHLSELVHQSDERRHHDVQVVLATHRPTDRQTRDARVTLDPSFNPTRCSETGGSS